MCLLLETIKIENGEIRNLEYHNRRFNSSRREKFGNAGSIDSGGDSGPGNGGSIDSGAGGDFSPGAGRDSGPGTGGSIDSGAGGDFDLGSILSVPSDMKQGIFRCRVLYRQEIEKIEFVPHKEHIVRSLKLVSSDDIEYSVKYAEREQLMSLFELRGDCDEILIVKNGFITDTSISNIVFRRPDGNWVTPDTPLLNGTMRMFLLESGRINEAPVRPGDLGSFTSAKMINCMMGLDSSPVIEIKQIFD